MELTDDERKALERYRVRHERKSYPEYVDDLKLLAEIAERDRPIRTYGDLVIRWDDPITPERLVACGYLSEQAAMWITNGKYQITLYASGLWEVTHLAFCIHEKVYPNPRNMLEVWSLMERCSIKETK